jgi:hypothetical protein
VEQSLGLTRLGRSSPRAERRSPGGESEPVLAELADLVVSGSNRTSIGVRVISPVSGAIISAVRSLRSSSTGVSDQQSEITVCSMRAQADPVTRAPHPTARA